MGVRAAEGPHVAARGDEQKSGTAAQSRDARHPNALRETGACDGGRACTSEAGDASARGRQPVAVGRDRIAG